MDEARVWASQPLVSRVRKGMQSSERENLPTPEKGNQMLGNQEHKQQKVSRHLLQHFRGSLGGLHELIHLGRTQ